MRLRYALAATCLLLAPLIVSPSGEPAGAAAIQEKGDPSSPEYLYPAGGSSYRYQPLAAPAPVVQAMLDQVDEVTLSQFIGYLSGEEPVEIGGEAYTILTRNSFSGEPVLKASEYLYEFYQAEGISAGYQDFLLGDIPLRNVIAELPGSLVQDQISLISAHYDDAPFGPIAPGADDNASGTAAVMLAAKILSQYDFGCTLRFANFSGEEQGLVGSKAAASQSFCQRENLRAVLNLDMIGWNTPGTPAAMELHAHAEIPGSQDIALLYQDVIETYSLELTPEIVFSSTAGSDHASYWSYEFPAILAIEDLADFNPHYHQTTDRLEQLDLSYLVNIAKASLAAMAHLGCLVDSGRGTISGEIASESDGLPIAKATVSFYHTEWGISIRTTSDDQGRYSQELAASDYLVTADALGFSLSQIGLVSVAPGIANTQDINLQPAQESANFLPLVQDTPTNSACP